MGMILVRGCGPRHEAAAAWYEEVIRHGRSDRNHIAFQMIYAPDGHGHNGGGLLNELSRSERRSISRRVHREEKARETDVTERESISRNWG